MRQGPISTPLAATFLPGAQRLAMQAEWMCQYGFHASHLVHAMVSGRDIEALVRFSSLCWHTGHAGIMVLAGDAEGLVPS